MTTAGDKNLGDTWNWTKYMPGLKYNYFKLFSINWLSLGQNNLVMEKYTTLVVSLLLLLLPLLSFLSCNESPLFLTQFPKFKSVSSASSPQAIL